MADKKERARLRWEILTKAIKDQSISTKSSSVSGFQGFELFNKVPQDRSEANEILEFVLYSHPTTNSNILIKHRSKGSIISIKELQSADNTGNIRIWPAEEVLAYFLTACPFLKEKVETCSSVVKIIEIGAGMSGLAGLSIFQRWKEISDLPLHLWITDGNDMCVETIQEIVDLNKLEGLIDDNQNQLKTLMLQWQDVNAVFPNDSGTFDFIIAADCVFLEQYHDSLLEMIDFLLSETGIFILLAPSRSGSRFRFKQKALKHLNFQVDETQHYSDILWQKHIALLDDLDVNKYEPLNHFPSLFLITKKR